MDMWNVCIHRFEKMQICCMEFNASITYEKKDLLLCNIFSLSVSSIVIILNELDIDEFIGFILFENKFQFIKK